MSSSFIGDKFSHLSKAPVFRIHYEPSVCANPSHFDDPKAKAISPHTGVWKAYTDSGTVYLHSSNSQGDCVHGQPAFKWRITKDEDGIKTVSETSVTEEDMKRVFPTFAETLEHYLHPEYGSLQLHPEIASALMGHDSSGNLVAEYASLRPGVKDYILDHPGSITFWVARSPYNVKDLTVYDKEVAIRNDAMLRSLQDAAGCRSGTEWTGEDAKKFFSQTPQWDAKLSFVGGRADFPRSTSVTTPTIDVSYEDYKSRCDGCEVPATLEWKPLTEEQPSGVMFELWLRTDGDTPSELLGATQGEQQVHLGEPSIIHLRTDETSRQGESSQYRRISR